MELLQIPDAETMKEYVKATPMHLWPDSRPDVVVGLEALTKEQCEGIVRDFSVIEPYHYPGCGAGETTEGLRPMRSSLEPIRRFGLGVAYNQFHFDVDTDVSSWMQTYREGDEYQPHMDATPGQSRKMTVVALLSDYKDYAGGTLQIFYPPHWINVPAAQGTLVAFPAWLIHRVTPITAGKRYSLNMGIFGPPFR